ncbi:MAG: YhfZ family protein [Brevinema sp.]
MNIYINRNIMIRQYNRTKFSTAEQHISFLCSITPKNSRLPSIKSIAHLLKMSVGMVQKVFAEFEENQTISLSKRGVQGTFLQEKNIEKLYQINQQAPIFGTLPLPYTLRYERLTESIEQQIQHILPCYFMHTKGAVSRLKLLISGKADFGIVSKFSFLNNYDPTLEILYEYGAHSYLEKHVIVTRVGEKIQKGMCIGFDPYSFDQTFLVSNIFSKQDFSFSHINYHSLIDKLTKKEIDITILNFDEDRVKALYPIDILFNNYPQEMTEAVLVSQTDNFKIKHLIGGNKLWNI